MIGVGFDTMAEVYARKAPFAERKERLAPTILIDFDTGAAFAQMVAGLSYEGGFKRYYGGNHESVCRMLDSGFVIRYL